MEKIEFIPAAHKSKLKWIVAVLAVVVVFSAAILFMAALAPAAAAAVQPADTRDSDSYYQAYQKEAEDSAAKDLTISQQAVTIEDQKTTIADQETLIAELRETIEALTAEKDTYAETSNTLQKQLDALTEQFGTAYYIVFEVRRDGMIEEVLTLKTSVPESAYLQYQIGAEVPVSDPYLSLPSDWMGVDWTATVRNAYPSPVTLF